MHHGPIAAIGHAYGFDHQRGSAYIEKVLRRGIFDRWILLRNDPDDFIPGLGGVDDLEAAFTPDHQRNDLVGKDDGSAHGQDGQDHGIRFRSTAGIGCASRLERIGH